jgi:hypothetical protein
MRRDEGELRRIRTKVGLLSAAGPDVGALAANVGRWFGEERVR